MYTFSNVGFMGLPVVQAVLGEEVMIYAMLFLIPNNLVLFSYGEYLMRDTRGFSLRSFFSPPIVASLLAVGICLLNLRFPYPIAKVISYVGGITTPLAMIIIGITLLGVQGKEIIKNKDLLVFLVVKMLVLPLVGYGLLYVLSVPEVMVHIFRVLC